MKDKQGMIVDHFVRSFVRSFVPYELHATIATYRIRWRRAAQKAERWVPRAESWVPKGVVGCEVGAEG